MKTYNFITSLGRMTKFFALIMVFSTLVFTSCKEEEMAVSIGSKAPEFALSSSTGSDVKLSDFSNKVVVLFFLGNNCPSCKAAAPNVESMLVTPFSKRTDYMVLGMDQWDGNAASVEAFRTSTGLSVPVLLKASATAKVYGTTYDRIVVIDKAGNIVFSGAQGAAADIVAVKMKVETLLGTTTQNPVAGNAPAFTLASSAGGDVKLSDFSNKVVVLFFLGNGCPSCKAAAPNVESMLVTPFSKRTDYMVLGMDQWDGNAASVEAFKTSTGLSVPVLLKASETAKAYGTTYDRIVVIDKAGNIVFSGAQGAAADIAAVKMKVETLLGITTQNPVAGNAPAFTLASLAGGDVKLSDFPNKVVVLFFFGNSCSSCRAAAPSIESMLVTPYASRTDYMVLGLDQWNGNSASVQSFKTATGVTFPLLLNASTVAADYKTTYDRLVIIDKAGNIAFTGSQLAASDIPAAKTKINSLLGL